MASDDNIPEKTRTQLQQEHEAIPIEEHDPCACDCERCVRKQKNIMSIKELKENKIQITRHNCEAEDNMYYNSGGESM